MKFQFQTHETDLFYLPEPSFTNSPPKKESGGFFESLGKKFHRKFPSITPNSIHIFLSSCEDDLKISYDSKIKLTTANCSAFNQNSCYEVPYMLDFIIKNYDTFKEENIVFIQEFSPKNHSFDIVYPQLLDIANSNYFKKENYGGFPKCDWEKGCVNIYYADIYCHIYDNTTIPAVWERHSSFPSRSTFFVKTEAIRKRPKKDYITILENLRKWLEINANIPEHCSNTFRATWHILLSGLQYVNTPSDDVNWLMKSDKKCTFIDFINSTNAWTR